MVLNFKDYFLHKIMLLRTTELPARPIYTVHPPPLEELIAPVRQTLVTVGCLLAISCSQILHQCQL